MFALIGAWASRDEDLEFADGAFQILVIIVLLLFMFGSGALAIYLSPGLFSISIFTFLLLADAYVLSDRLDKIEKDIETKIENMEDLFDECEFIEKHKNDS